MVLKRPLNLRRMKFFEDAFRVIAYLGIFFSGIAVFVWPLQTYDGISSIFMYSWGIFQLFAIIGAFALIFRKPLWEWRVVVWMAVGVFGYFTLTLLSVLQGSETFLARLGDIGALVALLVSRFFFQWGEVLKAQEIESVVRDHEEENR